jgi:hypothetical protein
MTETIRLIIQRSRSASAKPACKRELRRQCVGASPANLSPRGGRALDVTGARQLRADVCGRTKPARLEGRTCGNMTAGANAGGHRQSRTRSTRPSPAPLTNDAIASRRRWPSGTSQRVRVPRTFFSDHRQDPASWESRTERASHRTGFSLPPPE